MKKLLVILVLIALSVQSYIVAQNYICTYCARTIQEKFIKVDNRYYHPEHFKCSKCKRPIAASYLNKNGRYYHQECAGVSESLDCDYCGQEISGLHYVQNNKHYHNDCYEKILPDCFVCGKPINGKYYVKDNQKIHEDCFLEKVAKQCSVCRKPLAGRYLIDIHDNEYHDYHESTHYKCDNCNRIISRFTTAGGKRYKDDRNMCMYCIKNAVTGYIEVKSLYNKIVKQLESIGFEVDITNVVLKGADRIKLKEVAGARYSNAMRGYCQTLVETRKSGYSTTVNKYFTIHILEGIPKDYITATIVHELMHVWIHQNTSIRHSPQLEEGSCNYLSYLFLKTKSGVMIEEVIRGIERDPDTIYGDGFRKAKAKFEGYDLDEFLEYLLDHSDF